MMLAALPTLAPGAVWLVGAGPGDPGLLTVLASHALSEADIVLYDALINADLLGAMGSHGRAIAVGRRKGKVTRTEAQTVALIIRYAVAGLRVVRLKGGDPFVFGRGGEEVEALSRAGIPFRIVPGITAGIGGLAYAGIAVTRRGVNPNVTFLTAHDETGSVPLGVDWVSLARNDQTLVVYMGLSVLDEIVRTLLVHGRDHLTPVAIISHATTSWQRTLLSTLGESILAARRARLPTPAIIVIGGAADPVNIFPWFDPDEAGQTIDAPPTAFENARG